MQDVPRIEVIVTAAHLFTLFSRSHPLGLEAMHSSGPHHHVWNRTKFCVRAQFLASFRFGISISHPHQIFGSVRLYLFESISEMVTSAS